MVSLEPLQSTSNKCPMEANSTSPRISFSGEFLDENNFISICPKEREREEGERESGTVTVRNLEFEFLSGDVSHMMTADELFSEGKMLPFPQVKITLKGDDGPPDSDQNVNEERRISWFLDDDPSPRPPKCTVLWKELLRLKRQRPSTLSPSSSSSSSSSSEERKKKGGGKVVKKGLERSGSANIRIINVPICTHATTNRRLQR